MSSEQARILETQEAFRKLDALLTVKERMNIGPNSRAFRNLEQDIHTAQVDLNYCQYFPSCDKYQSLIRAKAQLSELDQIQDGGIAVGSLARIWKLVEQCTEHGRLQDLKDGLLLELTRTSLDSTRENGQTSPAIIDDPALENPSDSGSDTGMMTTNIQDSLLVGDEYGDEDVIRDTGKSRSLAENISESPIGDSQSSSDDDSEDKGQLEEDNRSEDGDAMMDYSKSNPVALRESGNQNRDGLTKDEAEALTTVAGRRNERRVLADLSQEDLNAQLGYFHVTQDPSRVNRNMPVQCLVCTEPGHIECPKLWCNTCGAFNQHTTQSCPKSAKCPKCREVGHSERQCPYKLKKMTREELVCELCQVNGHIEQDCELFWRTSGRPWDSDLFNTNIRIFCYECGTSGHLGNDCSTRRPGKSMGTSTWSLHGNFQTSGIPGNVPIKQGNDMSIKGRAQQQKLTFLDVDDDDQANFLRAKVPRPARQGQIRINAPSGQSFSDIPSKTWVQANRTDHDPGPRGGHFRVGKYRGGSYKSGEGYSEARDDRQYSNYRQNRRRSVSPTRHTNHGGKATVYQPMPSAAQNAWKRHRM